MLRARIIRFSGAGRSRCSSRSWSRSCHDLFSAPEFRNFNRLRLILFRSARGRAREACNTASLRRRWRL